MDWTLVSCVGIAGLSAVLIAEHAVDALRVKRESACDHNFTKVPVFDSDDPDAERPALILAFCEKCGCKRDITNG